MIEQVMSRGAAERTQAFELLLTRQLIMMFGASWSEDAAQPSLEVAELQRCRLEHAMPVVLGALAATMRVAWATAPPGSDVDQLLDTICGNAQRLRDVATSGFEAGNFWTHAASASPPGEPSSAGSGI